MPARRRILLADGCETDINCFKEYLSTVDCEFRSVTDGADALECIQSFKPELVLLDAWIATVNGFDICQQVKNDPATGGTMILMINTLNELGDIERAVAAGIDDFLSKPVDKTELLKRVELMLKLYDRRS